MNSTFNAIIFDLGGVVLNIDYDLTINAFKRLGEEHFEKLYAQSHQDKIFDQLETGKITGQQFRDYMRSLLDPSVTDAAINAAWDAMLLDLPPHRVELLKKLREKYRIFLFSNTNEIHLETFRKIIGRAYGDPLLLESIFHKTYYSHVLGLRKPHPEAFQAILDEQGLRAGETLFIDDSVQHIEGAQQLGLQTIHLVNKDIRDLNLG